MLIDCDEYYCTQRLLKRGQEKGKIDDNLAAISKRISFFKENTLPVCKYFDDLGKLAVVSFSVAWSSITHILIFYGLKILEYYGRFFRI